MAKVIDRDLSISGHDRRETDEKAKASRKADFSVLRRVSACPLRLLLTTIGLVLRLQQRTHGNRTSIMATRTTTTRTIQTVFVPFGDRIKLCNAI
jgi:hypothetical protein